MMEHRRGRFIRTLTVALALTALPAVVWGQAGEAPPPRWFRVSWTPPEDGPPAIIKGRVFNDSPYRVTDVRLQLEGLDANHQSVGRRLAWAIGDIDPRGETFFATEALAGAVSYQITVVSYDLVSRDQAP